MDRINVFCPNCLMPFTLPRAGLEVGIRHRCVKCDYDATYRLTVLKSEETVTVEETAEEP